MPSQLSIAISVNTPPNGCVVSFFDKGSNATRPLNLRAMANGEYEIYSLATQILISVQFCSDVDRPITYQFAYFMNYSLYQQDVALSQRGLNLHYISDFSPINQVSTVLPASGDPNTPLCLIAIISDCLGGIVNQTFLVLVKNSTIADDGEVGVF
jgi:hypothetical protein